MSARTDRLRPEAPAVSRTPRHLYALVSSENAAAVALLRRIVDVGDIRFEGPEVSIRAALP